MDTQLLAAIETELFAGKAAILATIIDRDGAAPRGVGTAMVVTDSGAQIGTIGGGSMEFSVRQDAIEMLQEFSCMTRTYKTHSEASTFASGSLLILFRPFFGEAGRLLCSNIRTAMESGEEKFLACQLIESCALETGVISEDALFPLCGVDRIPNETIVTASEPRWLIEPLSAEPRIVIFGGGHVAQCVARQLMLLDYRIWVAEDREAFANKDLFPMAERVLLGEYDSMHSLLSITKRDHAIVMSRGHETDEQILFWLLRSDANYIGCIGSRRKIAQIKESLLATGLTQDEIDRLHAPVGLSIGAETPAEIAVSIAAELIQHRAQKKN
ncbi:MAG: hypothetical protein C0413_02730 [Clostridiales bacterium]|nr:hypothetical protein [Clostridiales bacterium]